MLDLDSHQIEVHFAKDAVFQVELALIKFEFDMLMLFDGFVEQARKYRSIIHEEHLASWLRLGLGGSIEETSMNFNDSARDLAR